MNRRLKQELNRVYINRYSTARTFGCRPFQTGRQIAIELWQSPVPSLAALLGKLTGQGVQVGPRCQFGLMELPKAQPRSLQRHPSQTESHSKSGNTAGFSLA